MVKIMWWVGSPFTFLRRHWARILRVMFVVLLAAISLAFSTLPPGEQTEKVRAFTRQIEFDFVNWTIHAVRLKLSEATLGTNGYLSTAARKQTVIDYLHLIREIETHEWNITQAYSDPNISEPYQKTEQLRIDLEKLKVQRRNIEPVAEAILQSQISYVVDQMGLATGGQPVPPVLFHATPLPVLLIISPRDVIRQDESQTLQAGMSVDDRVALEKRIDKALNVSSLVENLGGIGTYPTMVDQTYSLNWLCEVVAHEWVHNYLMLHPLGMSYTSTPQLRIINETTAELAGKEIGAAVIETFYPEWMPKPAPPPESAEPQATPEPPSFDFRKEMNITRVRVDQLLADGKIEEAEKYMQERRVIFWDNGYTWLRKLNQAYFAFHGAYADEPGGASGSEEPVGAAVRSLRAQSGSLAKFLKRIAWVTSFDALQELVNASPLH